jgi:HlyD family secretion protein
MKKLLLVIVLLWAGGAAGVWYWNDVRSQRVEYRTVAVRRGDLLATINATGTLEPEEVVDVGTQIAGEIESFGKDPRDPNRPISYGSPVEEGTVLAHLVDALYKARVDQARAELRKAEADVLIAHAKLQQADRDFDRARKLWTRDQISAQEYDTAQAAYEMARASLTLSESSVALAKANLEEASVNLGYTTIRSRVKGVILDRRVNIGQTVVASLNAPSLFLIAKDLSRMEIWASVNETDVGQIHVGQPVRFSVAAFPAESFRGKVAQIRLNASMSQSVVTYTVIVTVDNAGGKLLPFLTARVQFEVEERKGVLLVPNAALRWQPPDRLVAPEAREASAGGGTPTPRASGADDARPQAGSGPGSRGARPAAVWVRQGEFVRPIAVLAGLSDGVATAIEVEVEGGSGGDTLAEGTEVVLGVVKREGDDEAGASPFLPKIKNDKAKPKK